MLKYIVCIKEHKPFLQNKRYEVFYPFGINYPFISGHLKEAIELKKLPKECWITEEEFIIRDRDRKITSIIN